MKKYLSIAALFLLGDEVVSWIALAVLAIAALVWFVKEVDREASGPRF